MTLNSPKIKSTKSSGKFVASALALALAAGIATPTFLNTPSTALAEAVRVEGVAQTPSFADVVSVVSPAVVSVQVESNARPVGNERGNQIPDQFRNGPLDKFFQDRRGNRGGRDRQAPRRFGQSQGSGFFISEDGYVVTNNHVVENGSKYTVVMSDGTKLNAKLIGTDPRTDLAVLKVEEKRTFTYVDFANENGARVGDWVVAVGNPFGLGGTVTAGIVSARGRDIGSGPYDDFLQIDAAVNRGNSGGPAFNLKGEVIGVNTAIFSPSGGNVGIAFAIPASTTTQVVKELIANGSISRGWLGVQIQPVTGEVAEALGLDEAKGAIIAGANPDGPAFGAGLKAGDIVLAVNEEAIDDPKDLAKTIAGIDPGSNADLMVWRDGKSENLVVKLGELPNAQALNASTPPATIAPEMMEDLGLEFSKDENGNLIISDVMQGGEAAKRGFRPGDVVEKVNGKPVNSAADISGVMASAQDAGRKSVLFQLRGERGARFATLPTAGKG